MQQAVRHVHTHPPTCTLSCVVIFFFTGAASQPPPPPPPPSRWPWLPAELRVAVLDLPADHVRRLPAVERVHSQERHADLEPVDAAVHPRR